MTYKQGYGFPQDVLFDVTRMQRLFANKWFFVGTRGDVPKPRNFLKFELFDEEYFLLHGSDGKIRCVVNRCAHQSARLINSVSGRCSASIVCPNHQWSYKLDCGTLRNATGMPVGFHETQEGRELGLSLIPLREIGGMLFACLGDNPPDDDLDTMANLIAPYTDPFALDKQGYKLAFHKREVVDISWLMVMINNRECCHCSMNHKGLVKLFDPSSFNGASTPAYKDLFETASKRWDDMGLKWQEQAFEPNDCCRIARYPMAEGFQSISFDGSPACQQLIGPFAGKQHDQGTLSFWFNPNAWIHFTSDHIATNWVLPLDAERCTLYTSWIVHENAVEGVDYTEEHLTEVWKVTNQEDIALCHSMTQGTKSSHYKPGPFSEDERFCTQFCDWYMTYSQSNQPQEISQRKQTSKTVQRNNRLLF